MKRCIIFGCGYVGFAFAKQALSLGYQVSALTRNVQKISELKNLGVHQTLQYELDGEGWHDELNGHYDFVLNTVSSAGNGLAGYEKSYLGGQHSILRWLEKKNATAGTWIFTSSTSVYPQTNDVLVTEEASHEGLGESGKILLAGERVMREAESVVDRWFVARLAGIYGPSRHHILDQLSAGERVFAGACTHYVNYIHLHDICTALWAMVDSLPTNKNKIYNVADGQPARKQELVRWLAAEMGISEGISFDATAASSPRRTLFNGQVPSRKISPQKLMKELAWQPKYANYQAGYRALIPG